MTTSIGIAGATVGDALVGVASGTRVVVAGRLQRRRAERHRRDRGRGAE